MEAGPDAVLDYGYALEGIILATSAAGLGTCWLGVSLAYIASRGSQALRGDV